MEQSNAADVDSSGGANNVDKVSAEVSDKALDHAWQWFEYHAGQRLSMMRFAVTVLGGIGAAAGFLQEHNAHALAVEVALLGTFLAWCFQKFDFRTSRLIKLGEQALRSEQAKLARLTSYDEFKICELADKTNGGWAETYTQIVRLIYSAVGIALLIFVIFEAALSHHVQRLVSIAILLMLSLVTRA